MSYNYDSPRNRKLGDTLITWIIRYPGSTTYQISEAFPDWSTSAIKHGLNNLRHRKLIYISNRTSRRAVQWTAGNLPDVPLKHPEKSSVRQREHLNLAPKYEFPHHNILFQSQPQNLSQIA